MGLNNFMFRGRVRRYALRVPVDWFDWVKSPLAPASVPGDLSLVVALHGETQNAQDFLNTIGSSALVQGGGLTLPTSVEPDLLGWTTTWNSDQKVKAVVVCPEALGTGWPVAGVGPSVINPEATGEDGGVWGCLAGLASGVFEEDDVDFLTALIEHVETVLRNASFRTRGQRPAAIFRRKLLVGHGAGGMMAYRFVSERPGVFDAFAVVGGSAGGKLKGGATYELVVDYVRPTNDLTRLLVIHHALDAFYLNLLDLGAPQYHALHADWNETTTDVVETTELLPLDLSQSLALWQTGIGFPAGADVLTEAGVPNTALYLCTAVANPQAWPASGTWGFDGMALIWKWFVDGGT